MVWAVRCDIFAPGRVYRAFSRDETLPYAKEVGRPHRRRSVNVGGFLLGVRPVPVHEADAANVPW